MNGVKLEELLRYNFEGAICMHTNFEILAVMKAFAILGALNIKIRFESPIPES